MQFDEVAQVHRNPATRTSPKQTTFNFVSNGTYLAKVNAPGHPRIEPGMRVLAILRDAGNWRTLIGWRDLDTGELVKPDARWHLNRLFLYAALFLFTLFLSWPIFRIDRYTHLIVFGPMGLIMSWGFVGEYRAWHRARLDAESIENLSH